MDKVCTVMAVAKLQCARDILIKLLIRGIDEHAPNRGCCPQQPE
jgi:hypothetical protein